jgi:hypothetical protein
MGRNLDMKGLAKRFSLFLAVGIAIMISYRAEAQNRGVFLPYSTVGFGIGTSSYYGDLATFRRPIASTFNMIRWSVGGNYTRHFTPRLAARASFNWARIAGDDFVMNHKDKYLGNLLFIRNLNFKNDLKEFSVQGIFKLTPDNRSYDRRPQFSAYLFGGVGLIAHNPKALYIDADGKKDWIKLQPLGTEGQGNEGYAKPYSLVQLVVPFGLGLRYKINSSFDISAELGYRVAFSDYLDDLSGAYADPALFADDPVALALSNRSGELISARKGKDRIPGIEKFLQEAYGITDSPDPAATLAAMGYGSPGGQRGNRFNDGYMLGMIHIHYMLPAKIKCPPLK